MRKLSLKVHLRPGRADIVVYNNNNNNNNNSHIPPYRMENGPINSSTLVKSLVIAVNETPSHSYGVWPSTRHK